MSNKVSFGYAFSRPTTDEVYEKTGIIRNIDLSITPEQLDALIAYTEENQPDPKYGWKFSLALFEADEGKNYDSSGKLQEGYKPKDKQQRSSGRAGGRRQL